MTVAFPPKNYLLINQSKQFINLFENLLARTIILSNGNVIVSNDAVTQYTLPAEQGTSFLSGLPINTNLTVNEFNLKSANQSYNKELAQSVHDLNRNAIAATKLIVQLKTKILNNVNQCQLYTTNYPLLIDHIKREAILYINILERLQKREDVNVRKDAALQEPFWNRIMAEHAKFIRGYLDPSEEELFDIADNFGDEFDELTKEAKKINEETNILPKVTKNSLEATKEIKAFKEQGTKGIINCKIKSIILPLLADHVLREANHYLNLLESYKSR